MCEYEVRVCPECGGGTDRISYYAHVCGENEYDVDEDGDPSCHRDTHMHEEDGDGEFRCYTCSNSWSSADEFDTAPREDCDCVECNEEPDEPAHEAEVVVLARDGNSRPNLTIGNAPAEVAALFERRSVRRILVPIARYEEIEGCETNWPVHWDFTTEAREQLEREQLDARVQLQLLEAA